jgi:hypothetical protein
MAKKETTKPAAKKPAAKKEPVKKETSKKTVKEKRVATYGKEGAKNLEKNLKAVSEAIKAKINPVKKSDSDKPNTTVLGVGTKILNPFSGRHIVIAHPFTGKKNSK